MLWSATIDDQLFVFWRGQLIYKRWNWTGRSMMIDSFGHPFVIPDKAADEER